jgi:hypothetical protein
MGTSADDRLELMELCARYSFYVDTFQLHPLVELFTDDGVFDESAVGMGRYEGHDVIRAYFRDDLFPVVDAWLHLTSNFIVDCIDGSSASGRCSTIMDADVQGGAWLHGTVWYEDDYVRTDGGWRFRSRVVKPYTKLDLGPLSAALADRS